MEPTILYEDASVIVLSKPSGMIVYPDGVHDYPALDAWLAQKYGEVFFVHRLDRETSGVMVIARTARAQEFLKKQFHDRQIRKAYRAFVYGNMKRERGVIDLPIGSARGGIAPRSARNPYGTLREAQTAFKTLLRGAQSYVEVYPKTGRTHQIRAHMAAIQHPVICDPLYAPGRESALGFNRLALHAYRLAFTHPDTGEEAEYEAPLPAAFVQAEEELRSR